MATQPRFSPKLQTRRFNTIASPALAVMQKWHVQSAIGRGGILSIKVSPQTTLLYPCQLHTSRPPHAEDKPHGQVSYGNFPFSPISVQPSLASILTCLPTSAAARPSPSNVKRLRDASADVQNLFRRSVASDSSRSRNTNTGFRSTSLSGFHPTSRGSSDQPTRGGIDARSLAANPPAQTPRNDLSRGIDARSLAASPSPDAPRFTISREMVGGGPRVGDGGQGGDRPRFQSRRTGGPGEGSSREVGRERFQSRRFGGEEGRERSTRGPRGTGSGRPAGREGRGGKMGEKRPRRSGGVGGDRMTERDREERAGMMKEYEAEREEMLAPKPVIYEPKEVGRRELEGYGPAVVSGVWGMKEILGEKMAPAQKFVEEEGWIERKGAWMSRRQKQDVLGWVERLKSAGAETGETKQANVKKDGDTKLLTQLFSGGYITQHPSLRNAGKQDVLAQVGRLTAHNGSYEPSDEKSLLEKVKTLVGTTPPAAGVKGVKQRAKA